MKKVKMMLIAIGVLAIAGGALAFKVKAVGVFNYCVATNLNSSSCPTPVDFATFMPTGSGQQLMYVLRPASEDCDPPPFCTAVGFMGL